MFDFLRRIFGKAAIPTQSIVALHELRDWDGPLHVWCRDFEAAQCVRLSDGRFHVLRRGTFPPLLDRPDYILANEPLAGVLQALCSDCVRFLPAAVIDVQSGQELAKYTEVRPMEEITPDTLQSVDASGAHAWHFSRGSLFVTKLVMVEIQRAGIELLMFAPGFSDFLDGAQRGPERRS